MLTDTPQVHFGAAGHPVDHGAARDAAGSWPSAALVASPALIPRSNRNPSQINLLSKVDLVEAYGAPRSDIHAWPFLSRPRQVVAAGELAFNLDFYTDVMDPARLLPYLQQASAPSET